MAVEIQVLKNGRPVSGVKVFYRKAGLFGGHGEKTTDSQGYVSFRIDPGMASTITFRGNGINESRTNYHLKNGLNEFRF